MQAKLLKQQALIRKRKLLVDIQTLTFAPAVNQIDTEDDEEHLLCNADNLIKAIDKLAAFDGSVYPAMVSVIQAISTLRRGRKKRELRNEHSRGAKIKAVEESIAISEVCPMSRPARIAFVMEGPTVFLVVRAAIRALLDGRDFEATTIHPELDENLRPRTEGGWGAVYKWCRQVLEQAEGIARENSIFALNDIVVIQVDADVARKKYEDYVIEDPPADELRQRKCEKACPPPSATTDALRSVMLGWLDETSVPPHAVLCTPSKNIETWVLAGLFPENDQAVKTNIECRWGLEVQLRKYGLIE